MKFKSDNHVWHELNFWLSSQKW